MYGMYMYLSQLSVLEFKALSAPEALLLNAYQA